ncbi:MAG: head-tail connector protein [Allosphingosinicella sp.]|uniref:head-tail connector protein n=1 Tax=Allosphingosinicella sp. TaxID=2823234 RepID=UPI003930651B
MLNAAPIGPQPEAVAEIKAYLRIGHDEEDGLIGRLALAAIELCEQFTGRAAIARVHEEAMAARPSWTRLTAAPVRSIEAVAHAPLGGAFEALAPGSYAIDIDAHAEGWVRTPAHAAGRIRVAYTAGLAADYGALPDGLRHGVVRLAAHLYTHRDGAERSCPPAAVAALWRPWRRLRIG